jgi:hypothetical protein
MPHLHTCPTTTESASVRPTQESDVSCSLPDRLNGHSATKPCDGGTWPNERSDGCGAYETQVSVPARPRPIRTILGCLHASAGPIAQIYRLPDHGRRTTICARSSSPSRLTCTRLRSVHCPSQPQNPPQRRLLSDCVAAVQATMSRAAAHRSAASDSAADAVE